MRAKSAVCELQDRAGAHLGEHQFGLCHEPFGPVAVSAKVSLGVDCHVTVSKKSPARMTRTGLCA
jgi:hypothetical protein